MTSSRKLIATLLLAGSAALVAAGPADAATKKPAWTKNCTALNQRFAHGVGKVGARDATSDEPVTTFVQSNALFKKAMRFNKGLDRDHDAIACEKA